MISFEAIIKAKYVGDLFSNDLTKIKQEYKELSKRWHPDLNGNSPDSNKAMAKINEFYTKAQKLIAENKWEKENYVLLTTTGGKLYEINYLTEHVFELGRFYILPKSIIYLIDKKYSLFYNNYKSKINSIKYPNTQVESNYKIMIPKILLEFETLEYYVIKIESFDYLFCLKDIHKFYNGAIPDRHVAWILSRLYDFECLMSYNNINLNSIQMINIFVDPEHHALFFFGTWWYSQGTGEKVHGLPNEIYNIAPYGTKTNGESNFQIDLESIKLIGRKLIGDEHGSKTLSNTSIPQTIREWLLDKGGNIPLEEYKNWNVALDGYGPRKFIPMVIDRKLIYK